MREQRAAFLICAVGDAIGFLCPIVPPPIGACQPKGRAMSYKPVTVVEFWHWFRKRWKTDAGNVIRLTNEEAAARLKERWTEQIAALRQFRRLLWKHFGYRIPSGRFLMENFHKGIPAPIVLLHPEEIPISGMDATSLFQFCVIKYINAYTKLRKMLDILKKAREQGLDAAETAFRVDQALSDYREVLPGILYYVLREANATMKAEATVAGWVYTGIALTRGGAPRKHPAQQPRFIRLGKKLESYFAGHAWDGLLTLMPDAIQNVLSHDGRLEHFAKLPNRVASRIEQILPAIEKPKKIREVPLDEAYHKNEVTQNKARMERRVVTMSQLKAAIDNARPALSKKQREAYLLNIVYRYSESETARHMNIRVGTVRSHVGRAKKKIQAGEPEKN